MVKKNVLTNLDNNFKMKLEGLFKRSIVKKSVPKNNNKNKRRKFKLKKLDTSEIEKIQEELRLEESEIMPNIIKDTNNIKEIKHEDSVKRIEEPKINLSIEKKSNIINKKPITIEKPVIIKEEAIIDKKDEIIINNEINNKSDKIISKLMELNNELINLEIMRIRERKYWFNLKYVIKYAIIIYLGYNVIF